MSLEYIPTEVLKDFMDKANSKTLEKIPDAILLIAFSHIVGGEALKESQSPTCDILKLGDIFLRYMLMHHGIKCFPQNSGGHMAVVDDDKWLDTQTRPTAIGAIVSSYLLWNLLQKNSMSRAALEILYVHSQREKFENCPIFTYSTETKV